MTPTFRQANQSHLELLLTLMREFYAAEQLRFDERVAIQGLSDAFADSAAGVVYLIDVDGSTPGYMVVGFNFSLEFHGRYAWIDELYVRDALRNRGIGAAALQFVETLCRERNLAAVRLEVARRNAAAERLYRRAGYEDYDRCLLTKWIR